jgi:O-antigen/teichoic acid export membrane protein
MVDSAIDKDANFRKKTIKGIMWTLTERFGNYGVSYILTIYLARLLSPKDYGLIGLTTAFFTIATVIIGGGFREVLIRKKKTSSADYNTVFYTNAAISICIYAVIYFFAAPSMANFYNEPQLVKLIRLLGLTLIFNAVSSIQDVDLRRNMRFNLLAFITLPAGILSGIAAILLAFRGFEVMSLAVKMLLFSFLTMILYWCLNRWRPSFEFNRKSFKELSGSGVHFLMAAVIYALYSGISPLVIGKVFSTQVLGYYMFSLIVINVTVNSIIEAVQQVSFPVFSKIQDDTGRLRNGYKEIIQNTVMIVFPLMVIMVLMAEPLFKLFLTDKWLPAIPFLKILCITGALLPLFAINLNVILVKGAPGLFLKIRLIDYLTLIVMLFALIPFGLKVFLIGQVFHSAAMILIINFLNSRLISYPIWTQLLDIAPIALCSVILGLAVYFLMPFFGDFNLMQVFYLLTAALIVYVFTLRIFKVEAAANLLGIVGSKLRISFGTGFKLK